MSQAKLKCPVCGLNANYLGITCRCGQVYCMKHRQPEDHHCSFDYKNYDRTRLMKQMTQFQQPKVIETVRY
jgi:AN1-type zinc finger protein 5/6